MPRLKRLPLSPWWRDYVSRCEVAQATFALTLPPDKRQHVWHFIDRLMLTLPDYQGAWIAVEQRYCTVTRRYACGVVIYQDPNA